MTDDGLEVLLPEGWPRPVGYANGVAARGRLVFVAGQVGWDAIREVCRRFGGAGASGTRKRGHGAGAPLAQSRGTWSA